MSVDSPDLVDPAPEVVTSTERLVVRGWTPADAPDAFAIFGDPDVTKYLGNPTPKRDVAEQEATLRAVIARAPETHPLGFWALQRRSDDVVIGSGLLYPLPGTDDVEIGWELRRDAWSQGYASEAARALVAHAFGPLGLPRLYALIEEPNTRSHAVAERLGMTFVDRTSQFFGREFMRYVLEAPVS
jgi:[ribosomal protein S5]-alanine N-acetyltransferase